MTIVDDTFAEGFAMWAARAVITAASRAWALAAARSMTGFATSVIGCKCEAGIERALEAGETPDRRPGVAVLLFAMDAAGVGRRLVERIGQCVMTCPTTACYDGLGPDGGERRRRVAVGERLRYFGDGHQASKVIGGRRLWRIPVMDGEFLVEDRFRVQPAVGGGNLLLAATRTEVALAAARAAVRAMREVPGVILPFPDGVVRSGSKVGSRYKGLPASTNDAWCPTLKASTETALDEDIDAVLEIVIDGLDEAAVRAAMRAGIAAAPRRGLKRISAGNYGGGLGQYHFHLHRLDQPVPTPS